VGKQELAARRRVRTMQKSTKADIFDLSRWKPITPAQYVLEIGMAFCTMEGPKDLVTEWQEMEHVSRVRIVTKAHVVHRALGPDQPPVDEIEPYLLMLYEPECGDPKYPTAHCFVRTDVELFLE
jgi:hypothetical protein